MATTTKKQPATKVAAKASTGTAALRAVTVTAARVVKSIPTPTPPPTTIPH